MDFDVKRLPDDASELKEYFLSYCTKLQQEHQTQIDYLEEQIRLLRNELFGRKSEKTIVDPPDQRLLFDTPTIEPSGPDPSTDDRIIIPEHTRKKRGRKPLPQDLPRIEVVHDIPEEDKRCQCGHMLSRIGEDTCEKLDYVPAKVQVIRHIRPKYVCRSCEGVDTDGPTVRIAPPPVQLIPKAIATEGLIAHLVVAKFADGLPLYRQQKIFGRLGVDLSRSTMASWVVKAYRECMPLLNLLAEEIRSGPLINIDETPLQVLKEPGRANTTKSYMWLFKGGPPDRPGFLYQYHPTRAGKAASDFLEDYEGYVQSDAFSGYDQLSSKKGIRHVGCWAHARRGFVNVTKAKKKNRSKKPHPKSLADEALEFVGDLYKVERKGRGLSPEELYQLRQEESKPTLSNFKKWLDETKPITPPKGLLGKAIQYTLNNWDKLIVYIEDGRLKPDNNDAENAIRPFVIGRKNWLFAGHPNGAEAAAAFYSLVETAKANRLEPYRYLRYIFEQLPLATTAEDYVDLLPQHISKDVLSRPMTQGD
jgi:transposase